MRGNPIAVGVGKVSVDRPQESFDRYLDETWRVAQYAPPRPEMEGELVL